MPTNRHRSRSRRAARALLVPGLEPHLRPRAHAARRAQRRSRDLRLPRHGARRVGLLDVPYRKLRVIPNATEPVFLDSSGAAAARAALPAVRRDARARKNLPALLEAFTLVRRAAAGCAWRWSARTAGRRARWLDRGRGRVRPVDDTELRDLYAHAEALVLPSLWGRVRAAGRRGAGHGLPASPAPPSRRCASSRARTRPTSTPRAPRRISEASCKPHACRGPSRAAAAAGTTRPRRSSTSGASSCRESQSARPGRRRHVGRGRTGDESYTVNLLRELPAAAPELAVRRLAAQPVRPPRGCAGLRAALPLDCREPVPAHPVRVS